MAIPKRITDNHVYKFLGEELMTTYIFLNTNDEKIYSYHTMIFTTT